MTTNNSTAQTRTVLRKQVLAERDKLSETRVIAQSDRIRERLLQLPEVIDAETLFVYVDFRSEVRTMSFIEQCLTEAKQVLVPLTLVKQSRLAAVRVTDPATQLQPGYCGIPEPIPEIIQKNQVDPKRIDVVVVPGAVFDQAGGRLGYGGGYYDRFLSSSAPRAARIALAFDLQIVERVPVEPHDQFMDKIVSEERIYNCGRMNNA